MLVIGNQVFKLLLLFLGIVCKGKMVVIGNGVVLDFWVLFVEIDKLVVQGVVISFDNLMIVENMLLILLLYQDLDKLCEEVVGVLKIGMIGCGIGFVYEDKVGCCIICVVDLGDEEMLDVCFDCLLVYYELLCQGFGVMFVDWVELCVKLLEIVLKFL